MGPIDLPTNSIPVPTADLGVPLHAEHMPAITNEAVRAQAATTLGLIRRIVGKSTSDGLKARDELEVFCNGNASPLFISAGYGPGARNHPLLNPLVMDGIKHDAELLRSLVYTAIPRGADTHWEAGRILNDYTYSLVRDIRDGQSAGCGPDNAKRGAESLEELRKVITMAAAHLRSSDDVAACAKLAITRVGSSEFAIFGSSFVSGRDAPLYTTLGTNMGARIEQLLAGAPQQAAKSRSELVHLADAARMLGDPAQVMARPLIQVLEKGRNDERRAAADALSSFKDLSEADRWRVQQLAKGGKTFVRELASALNKKFPPTSGSEVASVHGAHSLD